MLKLVTTIACIALLFACSAAPVREEPAVAVSVAEKKEITIALLGATGMVGGFVLAEALAQGYDIRALARTPQKLDALAKQITIIKGDALDPSAIDTLLSGADVVVSALGPVKADGEAALMISTKASGHVLQSMQQHGIQRYIVVSGAAVSVPGDDRNITGWLVQKMAALRFRDTLRDKQAEYQILAGSSIKWTLVRCPLIDAAAFTKDAIASRETPSSFRLRAGELAKFIVEQIDSDEFVGEAPFLSSI